MSRIRLVSGAIALTLALGFGLDVGHVSGRAESVHRAPNGTTKQAGIVYSDAALTYHIAAEYSTATAVIPRMYGSSAPDSVPGRYRYTYTLVNEPSSTNTISAFALDPVPRPFSVTPPLHWTSVFGIDLEDSALYFEADGGTTAPAGWDSLTVPRSIYDLGAGDSLTFGFVSDRAPSMTMFYVQGYYQDSIASETGAVKFWPISIWNNSVTGTVIGPGTTTAVPEGPETGGVSGSPQLKAPTPNPTAASATVAFYLPRPGRVLLGAYDVSGRLVQVLSEKMYPAGLHSVAWNGLTSSGRRAATGVYFFKLTVDGRPVGGRRMVMVR